MTTSNDDESTGPRVQSDSGMRDERVIPVLQEELDVHKRRVETARGARVVKRVDEREVVVDEPLVHEEVDVERVAVNRPLDEPAVVRQEGDTTIFPVMEEVLVVEKRLLLKEEIRITRKRSEFREPRRVALRSEQVVVERIEGGEVAVTQDASAGTETESILEEKKQQQEELRRHLSSAPHEK